MHREICLFLWNYFLTTYILTSSQNIWREYWWYRANSSLPCMESTVSRIIWSGARVSPTWPRLHSVCKVYISLEAWIKRCASEQLFFISFARIWARNMKPEEAVSIIQYGLLCWFGNMAKKKVRRILTDPHSPTRYRVEGTVYNIHEFASAFKCSEKAKVCSTPVIFMR